MATKFSFIKGTQNACELPPQLKECEFKHIVKSREVRLGSVGSLTSSGPDAGQGLIGLSLSGGGIRSATFGLGVIQALADRNLLRYCDYLSTVSGGGYIGGALTWFLSRRSGQQFCVTGQTLPHSTDPSEAGYRILRFLREHGNYLIPGKGITLFSFLAVILRGILLNAIVWIPIVSGLVLVGVVLAGVVWRSICGFFGESTSWAFATWRPVKGAAPYWGATDDVIRGLQVPVVVAAACFVLYCVVYSLLTRWSGRGGGPNDRSFRYRARRLYERIMGKVLAWGLGFAALATLPWAHHWMEAAAAHAGGASLLLGILSGLWSFAKSGPGNLKSRFSLPLGVLTSVSAALFLYGLGMVSYLSALEFLYLLTHDSNWWMLAVLLLVASILIGWAVNLNFLSIHRYYRDRLMETYMPDLPARDDNTYAWKSNRGLPQPDEELCGALSLDQHQHSAGRIREPQASSPWGSLFRAVASVLWQLGNRLGADGHVHAGQADASYSRGHFGGGCSSEYRCRRDRTDAQQDSVAPDGIPQHATRLLGPEPGS